jgi:2-polyprenyl-3-methyl-5-hydroxy-6-metoxy-1,4-benzoquinol methylase
VPGRDVLPKPSDVVVCTDVLEHIEPEKLDAVLDHILRLTGYFAHLVISTRPANAVLPDGRNAHLIVETPDWWLEKILANPRWQTEVARGTEKELTVTLRKVKG